MTAKLAGGLPDLATTDVCKVNFSLRNCIWQSKWMKSLVTRYLLAPEISNDLNTLQNSSILTVRIIQDFPEPHCSFSVQWQVHKYWLWWVFTNQAKSANVEITVFRLRKLGYLHFKDFSCSHACLELVNHKRFCVHTWSDRCQSGTETEKVLCFKKNVF